MSFVLVLVVALAGVALSTTKTCGIVEGYGYGCEAHQVLTEDGYFLTVEHILPPNGNSSGRPAVLLQHGLNSASMSWFLNPTNESLGFLLVEHGYDVWAANSRGNGVSMSAVHTDPSEAAFWDFSWDEMAQYDLPATIDYILAETGRTTLSHVGISQGTCIAFSGYLNHTVAAKVNALVALAPVAYVHHQRALLLRTMADLDTGEILTLLGDHEFSLPEAVHQLIPGACSLYPQLCEFIISFSVGPSVSLNSSRVSYYLNYEPDPTSVKNMMHWAQGVRDEVFQRFDYGHDGNMAHYGTPTPPPYDLTTFPTTLPVALFTGGEDYLADPTDVQTLLAKLPTPPVAHVYVANYSHIDPILSTSAVQLDYPTVFDVLAKYNP